MAYSGPPRPEGRTDERIAGDLLWIVQRLPVSVGIERRILESAKTTLLAWLEQG